MGLAEGRFSPMAVHGRLDPGRLEVRLSQVPRLINESNFQSQVKTGLYLTLVRKAEAGDS